MEEADVQKRAGSTGNATIGTLGTIDSLDQIRSILRDKNISNECASKLAMCQNKEKPEDDNIEVNNTGVHALSKEVRKNGKLASAENHSRHPTLVEEGGLEDEDEKDDETIEGEGDGSEYEDEDVERNELEGEEFENGNGEEGAKLPARRNEESNEEHEFSVRLERKTNG